MHEKPSPAQEQLLNDEKFYRGQLLPGRILGTRVDVTFVDDKDFVADTDIPGS